MVQAQASGGVGVRSPEAAPQASVPAPPVPVPVPVPVPASEFSIVPVRGLPVVGVVLVGLVVAIATNKLWAIDFFHVVGGGLWTGIDLFVGLVIGPILGRMSIQSRIEFSTRFMPKMILIMPTLVVVTLAAGWQLARHLGNLSAHYPDHAWLVASYVVVAIMAVVALGFLEPANVAVLFELKKPQPNGELIGRLMKRFVYTAGITGVMQVATLVIMTRLATA
jgi:flagellar biosynthesis protein FliQ